MVMCNKLFKEVMIIANIRLKRTTRYCVYIYIFNDLEPLLKQYIDEIYR